MGITFPTDNPKSYYADVAVTSGTTTTNYYVSGDNTGLIMEANGISATGSNPKTKGNNNFTMRYISVKDIPVGATITITLHKFTWADIARATYNRYTDNNPNIIMNALEWGRYANTYVQTDRGNYSVGADLEFSPHTAGASLTFTKGSVTYNYSNDYAFEGMSTAMYCVFDGGSYKFKNIMIWVDSQRNYVFEGLGNIVKNVYLYDFDVKSKASLISGKGSIFVDGVFKDAKVTDCGAYTSKTLTRTGYTGNSLDFIMWSQGTIERCYYDIKIPTGSNKSRYFLVDYSKEIRNCYMVINTDGGTLSSSNLKAAIVSRVNADYVVENCYFVATGALHNNISPISNSTPNGSVIDSYYHMQNTAASGACGTSLTEAQMKNKSNFGSFNFNSVWFIDTGSTGYKDTYKQHNRNYPLLVNSGITLYTASVEYYVNNTKITATSPSTSDKLYGGKYLYNTKNYRNTLFYNTNFDTNTTDDEATFGINEGELTTISGSSTTLNIYQCIAKPKLYLTKVTYFNGTSESTKLAEKTASGYGTWGTAGVVGTTSSITLNSNSGVIRLYLNTANLSFYEPLSYSKHNITENIQSSPYFYSAVDSMTNRMFRTDALIINLKETNGTKSAIKLQSMAIGNATKAVLFDTSTGYYKNSVTFSGSGATATFNMSNSNTNMLNYTVTSPTTNLGSSANNYITLNYSATTSSGRDLYLFNYYAVKTMIAADDHLSVQVGSFSTTNTAFYVSYPYNKTDAYPTDLQAASTILVVDSNDSYKISTVSVGSGFEVTNPNNYGFYSEAVSYSTSLNDGTSSNPVGLKVLLGYPHDNVSSSDDNNVMTFNTSSTGAGGTVVTGVVNKRSLLSYATDSDNKFVNDSGCVVITVLAKLGGVDLNVSLSINSSESTSNLNKFYAQLDNTVSGTTTNSVQILSAETKNGVTTYKTTFNAVPIGSDYKLSLQYRNSSSGSNLLRADTADSNSFTPYTFNSGTTHYRVYWGTTSYTLNYPTSGTNTINDETNVEVSLQQMFKMTFNLQDSIYKNTNNIYSTLFNGLNARATHKITTTAETGGNSNAVSNKVLTNNATNTIYVDKGKTCAYTINYGSLTEAQYTYNLSNLFGTATIDGSTTNSKTFIVTADKTITPSIPFKYATINSTIVNPPLKYTSAINALANSDERKQYLANFAPFVSFYSKTSSNPLTLQNIKIGINGTPSSKIKFDPTGSTTSNDIYFGSYKIATMVSNIQASDTIYELSTVYGNYFELRRGDVDLLDSGFYDIPAGSEFDRNILVSIASNSSQLNYVNDVNVVIPNGNTRKQPLSIKGYVYENTINIEFTYAPFVTYNFTPIATNHSVTATKNNYNGIDGIDSVIANLGGTTTYPFKVDAAKYSWTYDLSGTTYTINSDGSYTNNINLVITIVFTMKAGYKCTGLNVAGNILAVPTGTSSTINSAKGVEFEPIRDNIITVKIKANKSQYLEALDSENIVASEIKPMLEEKLMFGIDNNNNSSGKSSSFKLYGRGIVQVVDVDSSNGTNTNIVATIDNKTNKSSEDIDVPTVLNNFAVYYYSNFQVVTNCETNYYIRFIKANGLEYYGTSLDDNSYTMKNSGDSNPLLGTWAGGSFDIDVRLYARAKVEAPEAKTMRVSTSDDDIITFRGGHKIALDNDKNLVYGCFVDPASGYEIKYFTLRVYKTSNAYETSTSSEYMDFVLSGSSQEFTIPTSYTYSNFAKKIRVDNYTHATSDLRDYEGNNHSGVRIKFLTSDIDSEAYGNYGSVTYIKVVPTLTTKVQAITISNTTDSPSGVNIASNTINARYIRGIYVNNTPALTVHIAGGTTRVFNNGSGTVSGDYRVFDLGSIQRITKIVVSNTTSINFDKLEVSDNGSTWYTIYDEYVDGASTDTLTIDFVADEDLVFSHKENNPYLDSYPTTNVDIFTPDLGGYIPIVPGYTYRVTSNMANFQVNLSLYNVYMSEIQRNTTGSGTSSYSASQTITANAATNDYNNDARYLRIDFKRTSSSQILKDVFDISIQIDSKENNNTLDNTQAVSLLMGCNTSATNKSTSDYGVRLITNNVSYITSYTITSTVSYIRNDLVINQNATVKANKYFSFNDKYYLDIEDYSNSTRTTNNVNGILGLITETSYSNSNRGYYFSNADNIINKPNAHLYEYDFNASGLPLGYELKSLTIFDGTTALDSSNVYCSNSSVSGQSSTKLNGNFKCNNPSDAKEFIIKIVVQEKLYNVSIGHGCNNTDCSQCYGGHINLWTTLFTSENTTQILSSSSSKLLTAQSNYIDKVASSGKVYNSKPTDVYNPGTPDSTIAVNVLNNGYPNNFGSNMGGESAEDASFYMNSAYYENIDCTKSTVITIGYFTYLYMEAVAPSDKIFTNNWLIEDSTEVNDNNVSTVAFYKYNKDIAESKTFGTPVSNFLRFNFDYTLSKDAEPNNNTSTKYTVNFTHKFYPSYVINVLGYLNNYNNDGTLVNNKFFIGEFTANGDNLTAQIKKSTNGVVIGTLVANITGKFTFGTYTSTNDRWIRLIKGGTVTITYQETNDYYSVASGRVDIAPTDFGVTQVTLEKDGSANAKNITYKTSTNVGTITGVDWLSGVNGGQPTSNGKIIYTFFTTDSNGNLLDFAVNSETNLLYTVTTYLDVYHKFYYDSINVTGSSSSTTMNANGEIAIRSYSGSNVYETITSTDGYNYIYAYIREGMKFGLQANDSSSSKVPYTVDKAFLITKLKTGSFIADNNYNHSNNYFDTASSKNNNYIDLASNLEGLDNLLYNYSNSGSSYDSYSNITMDDDVYFTAFYASAIKVLLSVEIHDVQEHSVANSTIPVDFSVTNNRVDNKTNTQKIGGITGYGIISLYTNNACTNSAPIYNDGSLIIGGNFLANFGLYIKYDGSTIDDGNYAFDKMEQYNYNNGCEFISLNTYQLDSASEIYYSGVQNQTDGNDAIAFGARFKDNLNDNHLVHTVAKIYINKQYEVRLIYRLRTGVGNSYTEIGTNNNVFAYIGESSTSVYTNNFSSYLDTSSGRSLTYSYLSRKFVAGKTIYVDGFIPESTIICNDTNISSPFRIVKVSRPARDLVSKSGSVYTWHNNAGDTYEYQFDSSAYANLQGFANSHFSFELNDQTAGIYYIDFAQVNKLDTTDTEKEYISMTGKNGDATHTGGYITFANNDSSKQIFNGYSYKHHNSTTENNVTGLFVDKYDTVLMTPNFEDGFEENNYNLINTLGTCFRNVEATLTNLGNGSYTFVSEVSHNAGTNPIQLLAIEKKINYSMYYGLCNKDGSVYISSGTNTNVPEGLSMTDLVNSGLKTLITSDNLNASGNTYISKVLIAETPGYIGYFGYATFEVSTTAGVGGYTFKRFAVDGSNTMYDPAINHNITGYNHNGTTNKIDTYTGTITLSDNLSEVNEYVIIDSTKYLVSGGKINYQGQDYKVINNQVIIGSTSYQVQNTLIISAYFIYTYAINIQVKSADGNAIFADSSFNTKFGVSGYTKSANGLYYYKQYIVEYGDSISETINSLVEPEFVNSNDITGYIYRDIDRSIKDLAYLTTTTSGTKITLNITDVRSAITFTINYNPILLVRLDNVTSGKGKITTTFDNLTYVQTTYNNSVDSSITATSTNTKKDVTRLYSNFVTIPTTPITANNTSNAFELDHNSTGPTYVCVVYGIIYTSVMTPYIESTSNTEEYERYIPDEIHFTLSGVETTKHFQVDNINYEDLADGFNNGNIVDSELREKYYTNNTLTTSYIPSGAGATETTKISVDKNVVISGEFIREYTIELHSYLSSSNNDFAGDVYLVIDGTEYKLTTVDDNGDYYFKNVHALEGSTTTLKFKYDSDRYENLYNEVSTYDSGTDTTSQVIGYPQTNTNYAINDSDKVVTFTKVVTIGSSNTNIDKHYESLHFMEKRNVQLFISPEYLSSGIQPTIKIEQTTVDPVGSGMSNTFKATSLTSGAYVGTNISVTNTNKEKSISATVQAQNNVIKISASDIKDNSAYDFIGFRINGNLVTEGIVVNGVFYEYELQIPGDNNGTTFNIYAEYQLNTTNKDEINIMGNGYFNFGYSTKDNITDAKADYTLLSNTKYSYDKNSIYRDTAQLTTLGAKYLIIKAYPDEFSTLDSVSAKYVDGSLYFSKNGTNESTATNDFEFDQANNIFIYSIKDYSVGGVGLNYMQYNTNITLTFVTNTWREHTEAITSSTVTKNGVSKTGYHVTTPGQLAYLAENKSLISSASTIIYIDADLDMSAYLWLPIENFQGQIISEKYSIKNIKTTGQMNIILNSNIADTVLYKNYYKNNSNELDEYSYASNQNKDYYNYNLDSPMSFIASTNGATIEGLNISLIGNYYNSKNLYNGALVGDATNTTILDSQILGVNYASYSSTILASNYYYAKVMGQANGYAVIKNTTLTNKFESNVAGTNINVSYLIGNANCSDLKVVTNNGSTTAIYLANISISDIDSNIVAKNYGAITSNQNASGILAEDIYININGTNSTDNSNAICVADKASSNLIYKNIYVSRFYTSNTNTICESTAGSSNFANNRWNNYNENNRTLRIDASNYMTPPAQSDHYSGTESNPNIIPIANADDLIGNLNILDSSLEYIELRLTSNIDFGGKIWKTIDLPAGYTFNGAGYTISNFVLYENSRNYKSNSMFGTNSGKICNLNITDAYMLVSAMSTYNPSNYGILASINNGDIYSINVNATIDVNINNSDSNEVYVGGVLGTTNNNIYEIEFVGDINVGAFGTNTTSPKYIGGIVGNANACELHKIHSSAIINTYGNNTYINTASYFAGIIGKATGTITINNAYFGNYSGSNYLAQINEYEKTHGSTAYIVAGKSETLSILSFYSSATFDIKSNNGISSNGNITASNVYMLDTSYQSLPSKVTSITDANLKDQSKVNGFDFNNYWCYDTSNGYMYPVLIGNKNTHYLKVELSVEGIDYISTESIRDVYTLTNSKNYELIEYGPKNENKCTNNALDIYIQALHTDTIGSGYYINIGAKENLQ